MQHVIKTSPTFDPVAKVFQYGLTTKQAWYIHDLARKASLEADSVSWEAFGCPVKVLSRTAAKKLIRYLLDYSQKERDHENQ